MSSLPVVEESSHLQSKDTWWGSFAGGGAVRSPNRAPILL